MNTHPPSDDFREQLSAWHDGALSAEASRFVLRRLLADEILRAEIGRWQAVGDVLRRQRIERVDAGMAGRVTTVIGAEPVTSLPRSLRSDSRIGWWATAVVVGMAAVLLLPDKETPTEVAVAATSIEVPISPIVRDMSLPPLRRADFDATAIAATVPPLIRAPLPMIEVPSRPWPRNSGGDGAFTVDYALPSGTTTSRP